MSVLYAILMGIIQGITEFLPVSSFGHVVSAEHFLDISRNTGVLFETMLHVGTLAAVILVFKKDIVQILREMLAMLFEILGNFTLYIHNRRTGEHLAYTKLVQSSYRKLTVLLVVSSVPTAAIGYTARRLVAKSAVSEMMPGIGILITGVLLLVVDFGRCGGKRTVRDADYGHAMWIGICQGLSVFPGISRCGLTVSTALLCGFGRTFAVKYSYLVSIPAILGAMCLELQEFATPAMSAGLGFTFALGMITAGIVGYFMIRFLLKLVHKIKLRYFAYYCFLAGILMLAGNYLL